MNSFSRHQSVPLPWPTIALLTLAFWLGGSAFLDFIVMPSLYSAGMMGQPDFASAGYRLFGILNRVEMVCGALVLTAMLALRRQTQPLQQHSPTPILLALVLLFITLLDTYLLAPQMTGIGAHLQLFDLAQSIPPQMDQLHGLYGILELCKLMVVGFLLKHCCQQRSSDSPV